MVFSCTSCSKKTIPKKGGNYMRKKLSMSEVLSRMVARVRRIESDAVAVAGVLDKMIEKIETRAAAPGKSKP